ncbi:zinc finger protein 318 isoform X1 [Gopherus flavomarginatus]|uniref:zinc finger protein 318 isoform X1 n=1 Tax=Gopherus flavomarginatus TaxID=286002 RepID=UPI0021CC4A3B|nr:zinc finger protein 318 isoform X1 [Gopherus flavomarginatus]
MYRSSSGRSGPPPSSHRSKESSSSGSRSSRSGTSGSGPGPGRGRPPSSASPPPPSRRHRSPSGHRAASRRSPSPHRSKRLPSPPGGGGPGRSRGRRGGEHGDSSSSRRRSPSLRSESSLEQSLRITVGNDRYCIDTPERRRLPDRLGSPVDNLSDMDRDDMADGPIFTRGLPCPRGLERYPSHEDPSSSPYIMRHDEDYRNRDVFLHRSDYSPHYGHREELPRGSDRDSDKLRKSSYPPRPEERGREAKRPRYDKDEKIHGMSGDHHGFTLGTRNYRRRSRGRSQSPSYLGEEFRELDRARRKREEEERSRNLNHDLSGGGYVIPGLTSTLQSSETRYLYRPDEAPSMPKKSILKKRVEVEMESPMQLEGFPSSSPSSKDLPLLSSHSSLSQSSSSTPFASEVENFLKRFNTDSVESVNKELHDGVYEWSSLPGLPNDNFTFEKKFGNFLSHKEKLEPKSEPTDRHTDFLLPHERASQDGSGFSRILGMMADSASAQEKRRRSFPDIEDEEKFLYGDEDEDSKTESSSVQKPPVGCGSEVTNQKVSPPPSPAVKLDSLEESNTEYAKIHDLLKTIGLDIGVAEIGKLAVRTQERLHGKKLASHSPDCRSSDARRLESWEMRRSRSDTRSPESSQQRSASPPGSFQPSKETSSLQKSEYSQSKAVGQEIPACPPEQSVPSVSLIPSAPPAPVSLPPTSVSQYRIPNYPQFTAAQMPQNYPPPTMAPHGYDAYGHYMAYAASGWPMYPPPQQPNPTLAEAHGLLTMAVPANPTRPNLRVIETVSMGKDSPNIKRGDSVLMQIPITTTTYSKMPLRLATRPLKSTTEKISDEKNRAAQKQKVIEEREKLKNDREARQKKLYYLKTELDRLRKQQGEMLRKKRREKDGHKDPLLAEVNRLQENIMKEISELHKESDAAEKKQSELDKVAQILGINIFEKPRKPSMETKESTEKNSKSENAKGLEKTPFSNKESKTTNEKSRGKSPKPAESSSQSSKHPFQLANIYEYYDAGNHWCKDCNTICGTMFDFFTHMHNKKHRQTLDPYNRPWASKTQSETKQDFVKRIDKITVPAKGSEFLIPITGYYCQLCHEFFGDQISGEQHVKSHPHNEKYKKHVDENPLYEERRNLDRQAGLAVVLETERRRQNEMKRKLGEKQKEEKDEKKAKVAKKEETKSTPELGEGVSETGNTQAKMDTTGRKLGIKLKLKKEEKKEDSKKEEKKEDSKKEEKKEDSKKEEKKEDSKKESPTQSSFGKFSWKKNEREDKNQGAVAAPPKEESVEGSKDKEEGKSQSGKPHAKPIEIKLSGKTVIPHTSPWTPVASTSTQAKIRPNLPVPTMIFRKSATATVSKPAPLNTFLSIKSSGATTKPLPVVKESSADVLLPPDIISKAFGGEEVILKGTQEDMKVPEKNESCEKPPPPPPSIPPPAKQTAVIPADEVAPGVSESDQEMLAMPVRPPPPPPSTAFSDQAKKIEKRNSCLATANAKDLYDIFYSSGGKNSSDSKLASSPVPNGENFNIAKTERSTDMPANSKPSSSPSSMKETFQNIATYSEVSQVHSDEGASEPEKVEVQETSTPYTEKSTEIPNRVRGEVSYESQNILGLDFQAKSKEEEITQSKDQASVPWETEVEMETIDQAEISKKTPEPQIPEVSVTQLSEIKTVTHVKKSIEMREMGRTSGEQGVCKESQDPQIIEVQGNREEKSHIIVDAKTDVSNTSEKDIEMEDSELTGAQFELSLRHPASQLSERHNKIHKVGDPSLTEKKLSSDSCKTNTEIDSPDLPYVQSELVPERLDASSKVSEEKVSVAVVIEHDASLRRVKLENVNLERSQSAVIDEALQISEIQSRVSELTAKCPSELDSSQTSNKNEQVILVGSQSQSSQELPCTQTVDNPEINNGSNEVNVPVTCLTNIEMKNSILVVQEELRHERSSCVTLDSHHQEQGVTELVNACTANTGDPSSSLELMYDVENNTLRGPESDIKLGNFTAEKDALEIGGVDFSSAQSDMVQEPLDALPADFSMGHLGGGTLTHTEINQEVLSTSAANDFDLTTTYSEFSFEQSETLTLNFNMENEKDSLKPEDVKPSDTPILKAELELESIDFSLGDIEVEREHLGILTAGILNEDTEDLPKLETITSIGLEPSKTSELSIEQPVDEPEIIDFVALTSGDQEDKFCTLISESAVPHLESRLSNSDTAEVGMPVLEIQGIPPISEILLQVEESKDSTADIAEMPSLSCDGDSVENHAAGCIETVLPELKETPAKEGDSEDNGLCIVQSKIKTADSSLETNKLASVSSESSAESPVG